MEEANLTRVFRLLIVILLTYSLFSLSLASALFLSMAFEFGFNRVPIYLGTFVYIQTWIDTHTHTHTFAQISMRHRTCTFLSIRFMFVPRNFRFDSYACSLIYFHIQPSFFSTHLSCNHGRFRPNRITRKTRISSTKSSECRSHPSAWLSRSQYAAVFHLREIIIRFPLTS